MKEVFILGAVVDFQTSNNDNEALMGIHLIIKNGKALSHEQIERVMKSGFSAMNDSLIEISGSKEKTQTINLNFNQN